MGELHDMNIKDKLTDDYAKVGVQGGLGVNIQDLVTGTPAHVEAEGGLAVALQDQHTPALDLKFLIPDVPNFTTITADTVRDSRVVMMNSITGMVAGTTIGIVNANGQYYFGEYLSHTGAVSPFTVTLDTPLDQVFPVADTNVIVADSHLNKDGSITPVIAQIAGVGAGTGVDLDITRIMGVMSGTNDMTDETFGGLPLLTNGLVLRHINGNYINVWNVKSNGDIALLCFDANYEDARLPSTLNSFRFRNTYAGTSKHGVTLRLLAGETLQLIIQDNLTGAGLLDFQMMAQGHAISEIH